MVVTEFKRVLQTLPSPSDGHEAFMQRVRCDDDLDSAVTQFFETVTALAVRKTSPPHSIPITYDPRFLLTAFAITRFPLETLGAPEEPYRFSLVDRAWGFLQSVDLVLFTASKDATADDFIDDDVAAEYMRTLNEFRSAWLALWAAC